MALLPQAGQFNSLVDNTCTSVMWRGSSKTTPQLGHLARKGFMGRSLLAHDLAGDIMGCEARIENAQPRCIRTVRLRGKSEGFIPREASFSPNSGDACSGVSSNIFVSILEKVGPAST